MIEFTSGNLLDASAEALVNTVNTVGVMGKGIALMFKDAFPENTRAYELACKAGEVRVGSMFVTERRDLHGPKWIVNFPTKQHWRSPSRMEWIDSGLEDLRRFIETHGVRSIALPPLGSGNGGLDWRHVRPRIEAALERLTDVRVIIYEPTDRYMAVAKREGKRELTPARAMIAELVRRYGVLGFDCSMLEIQKLAYLLQRQVVARGLPNELKLRFEARRYGPYADNLRHLLNSLDGSYLQSDRRLGDARPSDLIAFKEVERDRIAAYLKSEGKEYLPALSAITDLIDGFETPYGMELIATVDWLLHHDGINADAAAVIRALTEWPEEGAAARKLKLFDERMIALAVERLQQQRVPA